MALKYTITHNGSTWNSTTDVASIALSNGSVTGSITAAGTKTLNCAGKYMPNNLVIGAKTLNCAGKIMSGNVVITAQNSGRFVAVGTGNTSYYSTDGKAWTAMTGLGAVMNSVACGNGRFVAVGAGGKSYYSTNGTSWTAMTGGNTNNMDMNCVTFGNGRFVAVCNNGYTYYSTNGTSWTMMSGTTYGKSNTYYKNSIRAVTFGGGRFVCNGLDYESYYSTNGTSWTRMVGLGEDYEVSYIANAYGALSGTPYFVCMNTSGMTKFSYETPTMWPVLYGGNGNNGPGKFIYYDGTKFIVMNNSTNQIYTASTKPTSWPATIWTAVSGTKPVAAGNGMAYGSGVYALGLQAKGLYWSTNLASWTAATGIPATATINAVTYLEG